MLIGQNTNNFLINPNFDFWQRATSFSAPAQFAYLSDRWYNQSGSNTSVTIARISENPVNGQFAIQWTAGSTSSQMNINQALESLLVQRLLGKTVTFSIYLKRNSGNVRVYALTIQKNATANVINGGSWSNISSVSIPASTIPTASYQRYSITVQVPNDGTANGLKVMVSDASTGLATDTISMAGAMLSIGESLGDFEMRLPADELRLCQRYYQRGFENAQGPIISASQCYVFYNMPVEMRAVPTLSFISGASLTSLVDETGTSPRTPSTIGNINTTTKCVGALLGGMTGLTAFRPSRVNTDAIQADAEL